MISDERLEEIKKESTEFVDRLKDRVHEQEFEIERLKSLWETDKQSWNELMAEKETEIERLNNDIKELLKENENKEKVILKYDNIINELEHDFESYELEYLQDTYQGSLADFIETELEKLQKLKGSDKE